MHMRSKFLKSARVLAAVLPMLALVRPAAAQRSGSWEFSLGAGPTYLATDFATFLGTSGLANGGVTADRFVLNGVGRLGYNFTNNWGFSIGSGYGRGSGVNYLNPFAAITYTVNLSATTSPFFTLGSEFTRVSGNGFVTHSVWGARGGLGVRHMLSEQLALRLEARFGADHYAAMPGSKNAYNPIATLGFSYFSHGYHRPVAMDAPPCPVCERPRVDTVWQTVTLPPPPPVVIVLRDTLVLEGVNFAFDSASLTPTSFVILDRVAAAMLESAWTKSKWEIAGHTSSLGTHEYNMALSQRRAETVRAYLVSRGVPDWRLVPRGYGETNPLYPNDQEGRQWRNRRVELRRVRK
jgi:outer membrane protein OmpA-like peptidoglycan-associated protein